MRDESIKEFLENTAIKLLSIPASATKGGTTWRYLKQELERQRRKRDKGF